ncbi:polysaccharide deacetylase family protein [Caloramator sp. ALD01]|uniref:polysaccharide deacetylase family protein n=1 Tax=Caloramator sp. ALD01 TaxID=1031288 RepID=UPI000406873A|nr:polysaccharide deacetylase family protein [Caloramator sp. ALD01]
MKNKFLSILCFLLTGFILFTLSNIELTYRAAVDDSSTVKTIYLTFDDGPSYKITNQILDILKEKEVKATFFLIGNKVEDRAEIVKRMYNEGHSIGLHSYTHKMKQIYKSEDTFIEEMKKTEDAVYNVIGVRPKIIRFPGGSIGHLDEDFHEKLHDLGYKVYDWNARISDGYVPSKSPDVLYKEAIKTSKKWNTVFLLMHCSETDKNTVVALPKIIDYFKEKGYVFETIDEKTPEYYFRYKKGKP